MLVYSLSLYGKELYKYEQGYITYEIEESNSQYVVVANLSSEAIHSRSLHIQENRLRLKAVDTIISKYMSKE